jgi:hypothetical protein
MMGQPALRRKSPVSGGPRIGPRAEPDRTEALRILTKLDGMRTSPCYWVGVRPALQLPSGLTSRRKRATINNEIPILCLITTSPPQSQPVALALCK